MEEMTPPKMAESLEGENSTVEVDRVSGDEITFKNDGVAHTQYLPDDAEIVGIGSGWFRVKL